MKLSGMKLICLFMLISVISSCIPGKLIPEGYLFSRNEVPDIPQSILSLGKEHMLNRDYSEANNFYNRIANEFPDSPEAKEARFYSLLIGIMHLKDFSSRAENFLSENPEGHLSQGFYSDFEGFLLGLAQQLKEEKNISKEFEKTAKLQQERIDDLQDIISNLQNDNAKLNEESTNLKKESTKLNEKIITLNDTLEKTNLDYQKLKTAFEQQAENYRKLQEIEIRKEKMEKELRELSR